MKVSRSISKNFTKWNVNSIKIRNYKLRDPRRLCYKDTIENCIMVVYPVIVDFASFHYLLNCGVP